MPLIVNVYHSSIRHHYAALQGRDLRVLNSRNSSKIKMQKQTFFMLVLLGLIVISQVDALTSGGLQMLGKRGLQVQIFSFESIFHSVCFISLLFAFTLCPPFLSRFCKAKYRISQGTMPSFLHQEDI